MTTLKIVDYQILLMGVLSLFTTVYTWFFHYENFSKNQKNYSYSTNFNKKDFVVTKLCALRGPGVICKHTSCIYYVCVLMRHDKTPFGLCFPFLHLIPWYIMYTLFRKKRFEINFFVQQKASKFAIFIENFKRI